MAAAARRSRQPLLPRPVAGLWAALLVAMGCLTAVRAQNVTTYSVSLGDKRYDG